MLTPDGKPISFISHLKDSWYSFSAALVKTPVNSCLRTLFIVFEIHTEEARAFVPENISFILD